MPYASKGMLRHYYSWSDPNLGPVIVSIIRIPYSCHYCTAISSLYWVVTIKEAVNKPRHGRFYYCKYSQILSCHNIWILMYFLDNGTDKEYYKNINRTILDGNLINMSLIIIEGKYGTIYTDDSSCHGYYTIMFYSSPFTFQEDFTIDEQFIPSG